MLYRIDKNTLIDLPKWKCRPEFAEYYKAKRFNRNDVDLLRKLKDRCDRIEAKHKAKSEKMRAIVSDYWQNADENRYLKNHSKPIDAFDMKGNFLGTFVSSNSAAKHLNLDGRRIRKCAAGERLSTNGYMFRPHQDNPHKIKPYKSNERKPRRIIGVFIDGGTKEWANVRAAARYFGCGVNNVYKNIRNKTTLHGYSLKFKAR